MGVNLKELMIKDETSISDLSNKKLVVDGNNILYQFLATIRQMDGTPLMDSHGNVTSHLNGLFHRTTKLMHSGIKLCFVFDGKAPELKHAERERRAELKKDAERRYEEAKKAEDTEEMKKYAQRTSRLTKEMIEEAVELIKAMGLPVVMAPSEGEAQAAYMVKKGESWAEISQDYDCLLFGVPRMVQNLTISEKKKRKDKLSYETVKPCVIDLEKNLKELGISKKQLIAMGMLVGTDFNVGGVKGIGPKKALTLIKKHGEDLNAMFEEAGWKDNFDYPWTDVMKVFEEMPVKTEYTLKWERHDPAKVTELLVEKHDFSRERVEDTLEKMEKAQEKAGQKGLGDFM
ncbi:TPA: flap endonuclease-1 [Candidatus Woesearchaeota archaeon]|nr:flap endonuclease-1 [Candidatus Woesearchaeota archaeon]